MLTPKTDLCMHKTVICAQNIKMKTQGHKYNSGGIYSDNTCQCTDPYKKNYIYTY